MDRRQRMDDQYVAMRAMLSGLQARIWTTFPGILQTYDATKLTCTVAPAIQEPVAQQDGTFKMVSLPVLQDVPVLFPGCGTFLLTLPLAPGDEGLVYVSCRCIDSWWQGGAASGSAGPARPPFEVRMHDLSDGFFFPANLSQPRRPAGPVSTTSAQLRNGDGNQVIDLRPDGSVNIQTHGFGNIQLDNNGVAVNPVAGQPINLNGPVVLDTGSTGITRARTGSITTNFGGSLPPNGVLTATVTVTGAKPGDIVCLGYTTFPNVFATLYVYVSANDTVTLRLSNTLTSTQGVALVTYNILVIGTTP